MLSKYALSMVNTQRSAQLTIFKFLCQVKITIFLPNLHSKRWTSWKLPYYSSTSSFPYFRPHPSPHGPGPNLKGGTKTRHSVASFGLVVYSGVSDLFGKSQPKIQVTMWMVVQHKTSGEWTSCIKPKGRLKTRTTGARISLVACSRLPDLCKKCQPEIQQPIKTTSLLLAPFFLSFFACVKAHLGPG